MFRRVRRFLRGFPPAPPHDSPPILPEVNHAHRLMDEGKFGEASLAFYDLAKKAEERFPERAPFFYVKAGRAAILSGANKKGVVHFRSALTLLGSQQRYHRLHQVGNRIVEELRANGLLEEANEVESVIRNNVQIPVRKEAGVSGKIILPTHCPSCGAALRPNEVEWLDELTAACDYCGSPIRAESQ